jgi:cell division protein FtsI/penicillin-binding protein 2
MPVRVARVSWRLLLLGLLLFAGATVLVGRLAHLQILSHGHYAVEAEDEHLGVEKLLPPRGAILDRNGFPLALTLDAYDISIDREVWQDRELAQEGAEALSPLLGRAPDEILAAVGPDKDGDYLLASGLDYALGKKIIALGLPGVRANPTIKRSYPEKDLASGLLGFIGRDKVGLAGLEADLESELGGEAGTLYFERDSLGNPIPFGYRRLIEPKPSADVTLTIDRYIQRIVEDQLDATIESRGASGGTIIVMDPNTGAILAMASRPSFKLSELDLNDEGRMELYRNRAVTDLYEPGSVMKVVTMAAAVDLGLVTPQTTYEDTGQAYVAGAAIANWDFSANGIQTMVQLLQKSLNTGAVWVSELIGAERFYDYIGRFGFGEPTHVGLGGEATGQYRTETDPDWYPVDLATNSFGQGISVTPLQMITAIAAVANGGELMRPYVVQEIRGPREHRVFEPVVVRRVVSEETAETLREMLRQVVDGNPSHLARVSGYHVAGKTGTSFISVAGGYAPDSTIASFVGFVPAGDPQVIVLVKIDRPQNERLGGMVAAPVFAELAPRILSYLGIRPETPQLVQQGG